MYLAELPEVKKEDLLLNATAQNLDLRVIGASEYSQVIELPSRVDPTQCKSQL